MTACGAADEESVLKIVARRAFAMQRAVPAGEGAMASVLGQDQEFVEQLCRSVGEVAPANYNCPGQIVITGQEQAVKQAAEELKESGVKRCIPLKVSGPFHSEMLADAGKKLAAELEKVEIEAAELERVPLRGIVIPYVSNVTADYVRDTEAVKELLEKQISAPVRWQQSVELMTADGVDTFIEIGPKKTLSGFLKKIAPDAESHHVETVEDMEKLLEILKTEG